MTKRLKQRAHGFIARAVQSALAAADQKTLASAFCKALQDPETLQQLTAAFAASQLTAEQVRALVGEVLIEVSGPNKMQRDLLYIAWQKDMEDAAGYYAQNMINVPAPSDWRAYQRINFDAVKVPGLYMEFGVYQAGTIHEFVSMRPDVIFHGFDSFRGLPNAWRMYKPGHLDLGGVPPKVPDSVKLHVGLFQDTLPKFLAAHQEPAAFVHVDCDEYESAKCVLDLLYPRFQRGTVIVFDEYFGLDWRNGEYKAWQEHVSATGTRYQYLARQTYGESVSVILE